MPEHDIYTGACRSILHWRPQPHDAKSEWETWLGGKHLSQEQREKLAALLFIMCSHSRVALHHSPQKYKHEFDKIYAIKSDQVRLLGFPRKLDFIVIHKLIKKKTKLSKNDIKTTKDLYKIYMQEHEE